jgi:threonine aldolase
MANQLALLTQTRPGNEVVGGELAHVAWHESGAGAAWAGVQFCVAGTGGLFDAEAFEKAVKPAVAHCPSTTLVCVENTHNMAGGKVFPQRDIDEIAVLAADRGIRMHLDGARLWNASASSKHPLKQLARPFDSVSVCFSKGLGAPVGSALLGSSSLVREARHFRKMLGGGMRQAGILAAGALFAVRYHLSEIEQSHASAQAVAALLSSAGAQVTPPQTNIVMLEVPGDAAGIADRARARGVLVHAVSSTLIRLVTHRALPEADCREAAGILAQLLSTAGHGSTGDPQ